MSDGSPTDSWEEKQEVASNDDVGATFDRDGAQTTAGGLGHPNNCVPCSFYCYSMSGCTKGVDCNFCHSEHIRQGNRRRRRRRPKEATPEENPTDDCAIPRKIPMPAPSVKSRTPTHGTAIMPNFIGSEFRPYAQSGAALAPPGLPFLPSAPLVNTSGLWQGYAGEAPPGRFGTQPFPNVGHCLPARVPDLDPAFLGAPPGLLTPPGLMLPQQAAHAALEQKTLEETQQELLKLLTRCSFLMQAQRGLTV